MTTRDPNSAFVTRARSPDTWTGKRNANASMNLAKPDPRASRTTIDTTVPRPPDQDQPFLVRGRRRRNGKQPLRKPIDQSRARYSMSDLTHVELLWLKKRIENWIRFGHVAEEKVVDRNRRIVSFAPGGIFAFVRWASNDYGTVASRIDILRAVKPGERYSTVPYVRPGGEILLRLSGWPKVEKVLQAIDAVEALGLDPADAAPEHWHHIHNRLSVNEVPRCYTHTRHQAWLHRRRIIP